MGNVLERKAQGTWEDKCSCYRNGTEQNEKIQGKWTGYDKDRRGKSEREGKGFSNLFELEV